MEELRTMVKMTPFDIMLIPNTYSEDLKSLIASMLGKTKDSRPTIDEILEKKIIIDYLSILLYK